MPDRSLQQGVRRYVYRHSHIRHDGMLLTEGLRRQASTHGHIGGLVLHATAGFGRNGALHEKPFFERPDDLPAKGEYLLGETQAAALAPWAGDAGYARASARFAMFGKSRAACRTKLYRGTHRPARTVPRNA